jgi:hypothetical protein
MLSKLALLALPILTRAASVTVSMVFPTNAVFSVAGAVSMSDAAVYTIVCQTHCDLAGTVTPELVSPHVVTYYDYSNAPNSFSVVSTKQFVFTFSDAYATVAGVSTTEYDYMSEGMACTSAPPGHNGPDALCDYSMVGMTSVENVDKSSVTTQTETDNISQLMLFNTFVIDMPALSSPPAAATTTTASSGATASNSGPAQTSTSSSSKATATAAGTVTKNGAGRNGAGILLGAALLAAAL